MKPSRDTDRDGVINIMDCRPYNPRKQGVIHSVAARYGKGKVRQWGERGQVADITRRKEKERIKRIESEAYAAELSKRREVAAKQRGLEKAKKKVEYESSGGFIGSVGRGFDNFLANTSRPASKKGRKKARGHMARNPNSYKKHRVRGHLRVKRTKYKKRR